MDQRKISPISLIVLGFVANLVVIVYGDATSAEVEKFLVELKPYFKTLTEKNKLEYKMLCDYSAEKERQKMGKDILNAVSTLNPASFNENQFKNQLLRIVQNAASVSGDFCNAHENLQCSSKGYCDCAEVDESLGFKMSFVREDDACLLHTGSICVPKEVLEQSRNKNPLFSGLDDAPKQELRCSNNANCIIKSNRDKCTMEGMQQEFKRLIETNKPSPQDIIQFIVDETKKGVCVCKGSIFTNSLSLLMSSSMFLIIRNIF